MTPRQDRAKQYLLEAITRGEFQVGNVVPAVDVLAKRAHCSAGTIQSALNVLAQEGIVKRVRRLGTLVARLPVTKRVCVVMALDSHTNLLLHQAIYDLFVQSGFAVDVLILSSDLELTLARCREITSGAIHPEVVVALTPDQMGSTFPKIAEMFKSSVIYSLGGASSFAAHTVTPDQQFAARIVVEHLFSLGHRKIGVVAGGVPEEQSWAADSAAACRHLIEMMGGQFFPHYLWTENALAMLKRSREAGITAYWALNDHHAVNVVQTCQTLGIRVPEDFAIIGRHDTPWSVECIPPLTSISIDPPATAQAIVRVVEAEIARREPAREYTRVLVPPKLVVRASTLAPRA